MNKITAGALESAIPHHWTGSWEDAVSPRWEQETLVDRLYRCAALLEAYGVMVPSEAGMVKFRLDVLAGRIEGARE